MGADFIALSFVRDAADIKRVHQIMDSAGVRIPVIAKIEKPQAVANLEEIVAAFDAIMVAHANSSGVAAWLGLHFCGWCGRSCSGFLWPIASSKSLKRVAKLLPEHQ